MGKLCRCGEPAKDQTPGHRGKRHLSSALVTNTRTEDSGKGKACFFLSRFKLFIKKGSYCILFNGCSCYLAPIMCLFQSLWGNCSPNQGAAGPPLSSGTWLNVSPSSKPSSQPVSAFWSYSLDTRGSTYPGHCALHKMNQCFINQGICP